MISSKFFSLVSKSPSLCNSLRRSFTKMSARDKVPKLMKDPKFTRQGMSKTKKKDRNYDLTQPHIKQPELYYNEKIDKSLERKQLKEVTQARRGLSELDLSSKRTLSLVLKDLTDNELLYQGSSRLIMNIHEMEKWHSGEVQTHSDAIQNALESLNKRLFDKSFREFGIIVTLNDKYNPLDKKLWTDVVFNLRRALNNWHQYDTNALAIESLQRNLVHITNSVYNASRRLNINLDELAEQLHAGFGEKADNFKDISALVLFYTNLAKMSRQNPLSTLNKVVERALAQRQNLKIVDVTALIHAVAASEKPAQDALVQLVGVFVDKFHRQENQRIDSVAIVSQSLANARVQHGDFNLLAEKYVESNLSKLTQVKDLCFVAESFRKLRIKNEKIFKHIEQGVLNHKGKLTFNNLKQLISSTKDNTMYSQDFINNVYLETKQIVESQDIRKGFTLNSRDCLFILNNCRSWKTPDGLFTETELYYTLRAEVDGKTALKAFTPVTA